MDKCLRKARAILSISLTVCLGLTTVCLASEEISSLVKQVMPGVVLIKTYDSNWNELGQGSGFVIRKEGDVVTCYHVMRGYFSAIVITSDGKKFLVRNVTAINKSDDLARISLSADNHSFSSLSLNTTIPEVGQEIIAIGGPLGLEKTVSQGIVSAIRNNTIQITAPISPGSSGGPIFNMRGEVIGIVSSQMKSGQNLNFAIPANLIQIMQPTSYEQVKELREPYSEVKSSDMPLWRLLGYLSEEELMKTHGLKGSPSIGFYDGECNKRFVRSDKFGDAILCYDCIIKMKPSYAPAWNSKGVALYYLTRYEEALFCFNKSLELDPSLKTYWQNKGAALQRLRRDAEAQAAFTEAKKFPNYQASVGFVTPLLSQKDRYK